MLDCFDGLIGISGACASDAYVMDLNIHGIDETLISNFTGAETTPAKLLAQVEQRARAIVRNDVIARYADRIHGHTFVDRYSAGQPDDDQELMSSTGIGGIMVEIDQRRSNAILRIGRLGLYADTTGTVTITVYDLEDGTVAATHDIDVTAGESLTDDVRIALPAYRKAKRYFITHDLTDFYRVDLFPGCGSCGLRGYTHGGCRIIGGRIDTGVPMRYSNVRSVSHTSGLMAVITVECDHAQMLCEIKDRIALPYSLKVAEEVLRRGIAASERLNAQRLDMDNLKERADRLGAEYVSAMQNSIGNMRMPDDPFCFVCKSPVKSTVILP